MRNADYKSTEGLAKSGRSEDFGADVGDEENSHGRMFSDASHRERSELGEISTLEDSYRPAEVGWGKAPCSMKSRHSAITLGCTGKNP